nr:hypothetical protein [Tanacetum cinerariifolium]
MHLEWPICKKIELKFCVLRRGLPVGKPLQGGGLMKIIFNIKIIQTAILNFSLMRFNQSLRSDLSELPCSGLLYPPLSGLIIKPASDNMADKNVPALAPTRSDDQILPFAAWVPIGKILDTLMFKAKTGAYRFQLDEDWFILDVNLLREALEITPVDQAHQFVSPLSGDAIMDFVNQLGYPGEIHYVSRMAVNNLYQPWRAILSMINQCLTGKTYGFDRPRYPEEFVKAIQTFLANKANLDIPTKKGKKTKPYVIPYCRFTKLIIYYLGRIHNIHQRSGSPLNLAEDDLSLGNLKGMKGKSASKADKPKKLVPYKQSKPAPATKPKVAQEKPLDSLPAKRLKRGEGEDYDLNRAIQMSLETFQAHGQAHVGGVAICEQVEEATRQLPVVEGKRKAIATNEQAAQSVLALHTPKRRSTTDQFIFQRRTPTTEEASTRPSVQPQDDASANIVRDTPSPIDAKTGADTDITTSTANTEVLYAEDVQATTEATITTLPLPPPPQQQSTIDSSLSSRVSTLKQRYLPHKINQTVNEVVKEAVHVALQAPLRDRFRELPEADIKEILHQRMFKSCSYKSLPKHMALYEALEADPSSSKQKSVPHFEQPVKDVPIPDNVNISDLEDIDIAHLLKIKTRPDWLKHADALAKSYKGLEENKLLNKSGDMRPFIKWYCKRIVKKNLNKPNLEGPSYMTDLEYLMTGSKERRSALSISQLKATQYLDFGLEELVPSLCIESERDHDICASYGISHWWFKHKEFYITRHSALSDRSTVRSHMRILSVVSLKTISRYGYTYLKEIGLRRDDYKEYKISESDFKKLHPNDFEDLYLLHLQGKLNHLSGYDKVCMFNAVNMWIINNVIRKRVEDLQLEIESYQKKLNLTELNWDASDFLFKEDYTIVSKPLAVIYKDMNDQKKMMRETEVRKFIDGMLNRILDNLDYMVKDFKLFKYNPSMEIRIWSEDDRRRSKKFMEVIEARLKTMRIFRSLESFVSGRLKDVDYRLIQRTE